MSDSISHNEIEWNLVQWKLTKKIVITGFSPTKFQEEFGVPLEIPVITCIFSNLVFFPLLFKDLVLRSETIGHFWAKFFWDFHYLATTDEDYRSTAIYSMYKRGSITYYRIQVSTSLKSLIFAIY